MQARCARTGQTFEISDTELAFLEKMQFRFSSTVIKPATPVYSSEERLRIRTAHRNEHNLYRAVSAKSGASLISIYHPNPLWGDPYKIYSQDEWRDDSFDPLKYGRPYDFDRPFFQQFAALQKVVPRMAVVTLGNENSDYTTGTGYCRNCYLINSSEYAEDCAYGKLYQSCKDCYDGAYLYGSELCYECFSLHNCSRCTGVLFSQNCHDCFFSTDLRGCNNCLLCSNLSQKEYHILNEPVSEEEYRDRIKLFRGSFEEYVEMWKQFADVRKNQIWRAAHTVKVEDCSGDFIENSQRCVNCYDMNESQDCMYVTVGVQAKDCVDCCNMYIKPELCYDVLGTLEAYNCAYCLYIFYSQNMLYCDQCFHCSDCFGCEGLTHKHFCIFNQQYSEQEYNDLVHRIIEQMKASGEWGQFFPPTYSTFGYNESLAQEYLPLSKEEAVNRGFLWRDTEDEKLEVEKTIQADQLPDHIDDIPDDVLNWALTCSESSRPFKLQKQELQFYRSNGIPIPRLHPDVRYEKRMKLRNPRELHASVCAKCGKAVESSFSADRKETIYCEECYVKEMS